MLKCYQGGSYTPFEYEFVSICFAHDRNEAKRIMWDDGRLHEECEGEWHQAIN